MSNVIQFPIKKSRESLFTKDAIIDLLVGIDDLMPRLDRYPQHQEVIDFKRRLKEFEKELEDKLKCWT